jgi:non-ribosomal peptide synthetase component E (peptide arylation enzyme)
MKFETIMTPEMTANYIRQGEWGRSHCDFFDDAVRGAPDRLAVIDRRVRLTYGELELLVRRAAHAFLDYGIEPGDIVGIQLPNWHEFLVAHYALARIGAVTLPLLLDYRKAELEFMLRFAEAKALVICESFREVEHAALIRGLLPSVPSLKTVFVVGDNSSTGMVPYGQLVDPSIDAHYDAERIASVRPRSTDIMELVFSSGTTGSPKGILHTHDTFMSAACRMVRDFKYTSSDIVLGLSPMAHQHGILGHVAPSIVAGATTLLLERFRPVEALGLISNERASVVVGVPSHAHILLDVEDISPYDLRSWRLFYCSGAVLPVHLVKRIAEIFGCRITSAYGMSEIAYSTYSRIDDPFEVAAQTCGRQGSGVDVKIVDENGKGCPRGAVGEIAMRGPNLMVGYLKNLDAMRVLVTDEGFFRSGDLGLIDANGNLSVVGRIKDMIIRGGANIYPAEIEELLLKFEKIANVAVVGYPDAGMGERVAACIIPVSGQNVTLQEVQKFLSDKLASYKIPDRIELLGAFPMTATGKVRKTTLREAVTPITTNG